MPEDADNKFMRRCLDLAEKSTGMTYPNPLVGSVIVHNGLIIGEGYHVRAGDAHAEVNAVNSVKGGNIPEDAILYVNLEPCSHYGKTPPCADLIISKGIRKVVVGTEDTSSKVSGRGIARLREAGCEVISGVLREECRWVNRRFFTFNEKNRPYIILKWAESYDRFLDVDRTKHHGQRPVWITGNSERILVHRWRSEEQSILAGAGTLRSDNPRLNVREWQGNDPIRLILSGSGIIDSGAEIFSIPGRNIIFTYNTEMDFPNSTIVKLDDNIKPATRITRYLYDAGIQSIFVEGGAMVLNHFISENLWDEARVFRGMENFNSGVKAPLIEGNEISTSSFKTSILKVIAGE